MSDFNIHDWAARHTVSPGAVAEIFDNFQREPNRDGEPSGWNPIRWNCAEGGCFNIRKRHKIEQFVECFAGKNAPGDIDFMIERNGKFVIVKFSHEMVIDKTSPNEGQFIALKRLSVVLGDNVWILFICADPVTMECTEWAWLRNGVLSAAVPVTLDGVKTWFKMWDQGAIG